MHRSSVIAVIAGGLLCACGPSLPPLGLAEGCQPLLAGADCLLPYPSDFFRVDDAALPSGARIALSAEAAPKTKAGKPADVTVSHPIDGFSTVPTLVALLGSPVGPKGLNRLEDGGDATLSKDSVTLLVEADTHALVPHFADLDPRGTDVAHQALVLHPFVGLEPGTRYVVLVHGAVTPEETPATTPEGFRRLRDKESGGDAQLERLQRHYDDAVFPVASALGVDRASLQLAWDFTTGTEAWATRDLLRVRELTMAWLASNTPAVTISSNVELPTGNPDVFRLIKGKVTGPMFVDSPLPGAKLLRGADGEVEQQGTVEFNFTAVIPLSVRDATGPSGVFLYGHGFFGTIAELEGSSATGLAQAAGRTMLGTDWWGMHTGDVGKLGDALSGHPQDSGLFIERVPQGMANWLTLSAAVEQLKALPGFQRAGGEALLTGEADCFIGISQGHILGGTLNAIHPTTKHVVLQVGGAGLSGMMMRATPFAGFFALLSLSVEDPLEQQKFLATFQRPLDRIDPATYAPFYFERPLPGNAPKQVLMQNVLMDHAVPNLGSWLHARLLGLGVVSPSAKVPWGLEAAAPPLQSALQIVDFKLGDDAAYYRAADFPAMETQVHEGVRLLAPIKQQIHDFFDDGVVNGTCTGACDPD